MTGRYALIIATDQFEDEGLRRLIAPAQDAEALERVLNDHEIGDFEVQTLLNEPSFKINQTIEEFFTDRKRDDLLLLYFSGHGIRDIEGRLYFATPDTYRRRLRSTAIQASLVHDVMHYSPSKRQVLIFDCCHSGAFAKGMRIKAGEAIGTSIGIQEQFEGGGRVIITASDSLQYAFEGDEIQGEGIRSVFTRALVHGLESGEADIDRDGEIGIGEIYQYVHDCVIEERPEQRPRMWAFDVEKELMIARSPFQSMTKISLPGWMKEAYKTSGHSTRLWIIAELVQIINGNEERLAELAIAELKQISQRDENDTVRKAASDALLKPKFEETENPTQQRYSKVNKEPAQPTNIITTPESIGLELGKITEIAISPNGRLIAIADRAWIRLYDIENLRLMGMFNGHKRQVQCVTWSPDGEQLASGGLDNVVRLWDIYSEEELYTLEGHTGWIHSVSWSPDGRQIASGGLDKVVRLWDVNSGKENSILEGHSRSVMSLDWSPDGVNLVSGGEDGTVRIWDTKNKTYQNMQVEPKTLIQSVNWSPNGQQFATGCKDGSVIIWNGTHMQVLSLLKGHKGWVNCVAWSPDGKLLASGGVDKVVRLWDITSGKELLILKGHKKWIQSIAWLIDGKQLASGSADSTVRIWDIPKEKVSKIFNF